MSKHFLLCIFFFFYLEEGSPGLWSAGHWFFLVGGQRQEPEQRIASLGQSRHPMSSCVLLWSHTPPLPAEQQWHSHPSEGLLYKTSTATARDHL